MHLIQTHTPTKASTHGYTLLELVVVIAILGILLPVLYLALNALYDGHAHAFSRALALMQAHRAQDALVRDIRAAMYAEDGSLPLIEIATSTLILYADTDLDRVVERVRYYLDGEILMQGVVEPTATSSYPLDTELVRELAEGLTNGTTGTDLFRYYSATSSEITSSDQTLDVRRVEITIEAANTFRGETTTVTLRSSASIRNLKDSY